MPNTTHHYCGLPIEYKPENCGIEVYKWPEVPEPSLAAGFARSLLWASYSPSIRRSGFQAGRGPDDRVVIRVLRGMGHPPDLQPEVNFWIGL